MTYPFRTVTPIRTYEQLENDYRKYKKYLAKDFHNRCGYTNCSDHWFGGQRTFHIDHLKPHSIYPELKNEYSNLVYCCSYVNIAKSNDDNNNYLDPCTHDYNTHFERDRYGAIHAKTPQAEYMIKRMHLNLQRYAIAWSLDQIESRIERLKKIESKGQETHCIYVQTLELYINYIKKLRYTI